MNFVNPSRSTYHHNVISALSDENRFVASGRAKGYAVDSYSWLADFLFKYSVNKSVNPHVAYVSFFSDREIMYEEFGNVEHLYIAYPFLTSYSRQKLPSNSYELTKQQYSAISNRGAEFDIIEYLNISDQKKVKEETNPTSLSYNHGFWRAPALIASGRRMKLDHVIDQGASALYNKAENYNRYFWAYQWANSSHIELTNADIILGTYDEDLLQMYPNAAWDEINTYTSFDAGHTEEIRKLIDVKFNVANQKYFYFDKMIEWVAYYNDTVHYYEQQFMPYYGFVNFYSIDWAEIHPFTYLGTSEYGQMVSFFPEIIRKGIVEPAKVIANWGNRSTPDGGQLVFNNGVHMNDPSDQSRIVYNACRHMLNKPQFTNYTTDFQVFKKDLAGNILYSGIDIDTERNRRYSAVVMTEPYFVTVPVGNGEIVNYMFVTKDNSPMTINNDPTSMFLKIKTTKSMIAKIDQLLQTADFNTDIIETLTINDPRNVSKISKFLGYSTSEQYYCDFASSDEQFIKRQDDCLDDLIGGDGTTRGIAGQGKHVTFTVSDGSEQYSGALRKICGLGWIAKTVINNKNQISGVKNELVLYCTNYEAVNSPGETPITNISKELISDYTIIDKTVPYETFKPMLKLPGINGYVKIIERNRHFKITRASDGMYEVVYNVEFPYCPGSYTERVTMNFAGDNWYNNPVPTYKQTWILKKLSYIPAGSQEVFLSDEDSRQDISNDRYAPFADDSFCVHSVLAQRAASGLIITEPFQLGGGEEDVIETQKNLVEYPADLVWMLEKFKMLSLIKSRVPGFERYGTYDVMLVDDPDNNHYSKDIKLLGLVDNRQWRFAKEKFSSYINRENPSYVCEIDVSALFNDFKQYQKTDSGVPDVKRWLYGYLAGFAHTMADADVSVDHSVEIIDDFPVTEKISTMQNNDLESTLSESDIAIEIWDNKSLLGIEEETNIYGGNWRPFSPISSDTQKAPGKLIIEGLQISHIDGSAVDGVTNIFGNIYSVSIGYLDSSFSLMFPDFVNFNKPSNILEGRSNLALSIGNSVNGIKSYHIIYITKLTDDLGVRQLFRAYIYCDDPDDLPVFDPENPSGNPGPFSIYEPKKQISKNVTFDLYTSQVIQNLADNIIVRYIDMQSTLENEDLSLPDREKYIDNNKKIFFRIRVIKKKNYSASNDSKDISSIQYKGPAIDDEDLTVTQKEWSNFPWATVTGDTVIIDEKFDWRKILTQEIVRKLGMTYFKCSSK